MVIDDFVELVGEMKNRRTNEKGSIESKDDVLGADPVAVVSKPYDQLFYHERGRYYGVAITSVISSLGGAIASIKALSWLFSEMPQIPQGYASLVGIVVSSIVGISVTFLLVRFIYQKRGAEREKVIHRVRSREQELFDMLDLDFHSITKRREVNAGQTI